MNKYAALGLAVAASEGRRILVIVGRTREALDEFMPLVSTHDGRIPMVPSSRVRRASGAERIDFLSGGTIRFSTLGSHRARGLSVDTVYFGRGMPETQTIAEMYRPNVASSASPELIWG